MRLLEVKEDGTLSFTDKLYDNLPPYAILSHTWGRDADEVYYKDVLKDRAKAKLGYKKLELCAELALRHGLQHFWIDTCCIKQGDSSEVSEAVNSMFRWYRESAVCYVYLADVAIPVDDNADKGAIPGVHLTLRNYGAHNALRSQIPNWFTRGWTLQELIAPKVVNFYSQEGTFIGSRDDLSFWITQCTKLPFAALGGQDLHRFSIKDRLKWTASRRTKRPEDRAYCLLGIFGIHMNLLYGEGQNNAFDRLERKVAKHEREKSLGTAHLNFGQRSTGLLQESGRILAASQVSQESHSILSSVPLHTIEHTDIHVETNPGPTQQLPHPAAYGGSMLFDRQGLPVPSTILTEPAIDPQLLLDSSSDTEISLSCQEQRKVSDRIAQSRRAQTLYRKKLKRRLEDLERRAENHSQSPERNLPGASDPIPELGNGMILQFLNAMDKQMESKLHEDTLEKGLL